MSLTVWNPFRELDSLLDRYSRMSPGRMLSETGEDQAAWSPSVDISETDKEYLITAELPGVKKEDINVSVDQGMLTLSGERKVDSDVQDGKMHRVERFYGQFVRRFTLPDDVDADAIQAQSEEGVLKVHLPRVEAKPAKGRSIEIK